MILPDVKFIHNNRYYIRHVCDIQHREGIPFFSPPQSDDDQDTKDVWFSENRTKRVYKRWCFSDTHHTNLTTNVSPFHSPTTKFKRRQTPFATWLKWFIVFFLPRFIYMKTIIISKKFYTAVLLYSRIGYVLYSLIFIIIIKIKKLF